MNVGELKQILESWNDNDLVILSGPRDLRYIKKYNEYMAYEDGEVWMDSKYNEDAEDGKNTIILY